MIRAQALAQQLRCLVCQNQTIDESDAPLAHDLRVILRERLKAGDSDEQAKAYMVARYGHYVLLKPPIEPQTYLIWFGPVLAILLGGAAGYLHLRDRNRASLAAAPGLSPEEQAELDRLLEASERK